MTMNGVVAVSTVQADLFDIAPKRLWDDMIEQRYIRRQKHPSLPLVVLNYSVSAQYAGVWNAATMNARGLIAHSDTGVIVARGFKKFFNVGDSNCAPISPDAPVRVMEKADGSLGILYPVRPGQYAVATRGSFGSDHAVHATSVWERKYAHAFTPDPALTYLFEIIYPQGRIVLDYHGMDDLVLLDVLDTATGRTVLDPAVRAGWPGPTVTTYDYATFGEVCAAPIPAEHEGFVVHVRDTDERVKLKGEWYKRLHKVMTELSEKDLWVAQAVNRMVADGSDIKKAAYMTGVSVKVAQGIAEAGLNWLEPILEIVPDEFHSWVASTLRTFQEQADAFIARHEQILVSLTLSGDPQDRAHRKEMAAAIRERAAGNKEMENALLTLMSGGSIMGHAYRSFKPDYARAFWGQDASAA